MFGSLRHSFLTIHRTRNYGMWKKKLCEVGVGNTYGESSMKKNENGSVFGGMDESASSPFGTLDAEITPETSDFFVSDAEGDPDCPSKGYSSIEQALDALRQGKVDLITIPNYKITLNFLF